MTERVTDTVASMKEWALKYAGMGLAVFPIKEKEKAPATPHGCKDATTDTLQIKTWWNVNPMYNIGIATGSRSGGLVVIDLDVDEEKGKNGYEVFKEWQQEHGDLPETCQSITGRGGYHLFYRDAARHQNAQSLYEGIDIRGEGGYVLAPPSIHPNGRTYEWEQEPGEYEIVQVNNLAVEFLLGPAPEKKRQNFQMPDTIPEGERTSAMIRLIGSLKAKDLGSEAIRAAVEKENESRCIPPLTDQELEQQVFPALKRGWMPEHPYTVTADRGKFRPIKKTEKVSLVCMSDVEEEEILWLYQPYVPRGKVTICAAYPGTGKTYLLCYMAACVSTGRSFFSQVPFKLEPGRVIYLTAEDGIGDTIKKRLRLCGANMENIATVTEKTVLQFDSPEIEDFMKDFKPDLMIFDPFQAYIGAEINMNAPNETREKLNHIADLAEQHGVAVVLICHFNKNGKGDAITRVLGSTDIMGICRSYIALGPVPGEDDIKFMSHEKSSLDKRGKTILFEIDPDRGGVVYLGENNLTMDDYTAIRNKKRVSNAPAVEAAKQFIITNMPEGRRLAKELKNLAAANKISDGSLQRAKEELGIITRKTKEFPPRSIWILPGHEEDSPEESEPVQEELDLQTE